ncbi:MAG TPA: MYXO-CTERM sorting domain-containing protein [Polyangia bacterium]
MNIYLDGFTAMTPDEVTKSIAAAAAAWAPATGEKPGSLLALAVVALALARRRRPV